MRSLRHADLIGKPYVLFAEDCFGVFTSKIAASVLRYRAGTCVAVIDSTKAGRTVQDILGYGGPIPVIADIAESFPLRPEVLVIGKGLHHGELPPGWKRPLLAAVQHGLHVVNSIHFRLDSDPDLARAIRDKGVTVWETKNPPAVPLNKARVLAVDSYIIHTCGSDSNIGKKTTALQIYYGANRQGIRTGFAATGQSAMMITGNGIAIDAVPGDFMGGAVEQVVMEAAEGNEWVVVEGQGSLNHIGASGVALAILHGALPNALVFCHRLGLERTKVWNTPLIPIPELIRMNEELTRFERPAKVAAISVNGEGLGDEEFRREAGQLESDTGLPVVDPVREGGAGRLVEILRKHQAAP
ncbi:MAG: DUF1611 domain-containing protein [Nocardiopsaceae bacterium]|nr:DUF1611 domain-containing protein [Nocardiopsaceae bacterium]